MTQAISTVHAPQALATTDQWNREKLDLLKRTVAAGTSDDEFDLFCEVARGTGLNPFQRQIYAIMRQESYKDDQGRWQKRAKMTIQTGIDGYRLIAARTGLHAGTTDAEYGPLVGKYPSWARVVVKKLMANGMIAEFPATARWSEYAQTNKEGEPTGQWPKMPYLMLAKCAEALALRKAFPAELSGVYTAEEMSQADTYTSGPTIDTETGEVRQATTQGPKPRTSVVKPQGELTQPQQKRLFAIAKQHNVSNDALKDLMLKHFKIDSSSKLTREQYDELCDVLIPEAGSELEQGGFEDAPGVAIEAELVTEPDHK
jgi:phage recombination protein Bet